MERKRPNRIRLFCFVGFCIGIITAFLILAPIIKVSSLNVPAGLYLTLEMCSLFVAAMVAFTCLNYFMTTENRFYFLVGTAFLVLGLTPFLCALFGYPVISGERALETASFWPAVGSAGACAAGLFFIAAVLFENGPQGENGDNRQPFLFFFLLAPCALLPAGLYSIFHIQGRDELLANPLGVAATTSFFIAFAFLLKRFLENRDYFSGFILLTVLLNTGAEALLLFSKIPGDAEHFAAWGAKFLGFFLPLMGVLSQFFRMTKDVKRLTDEKGRLQRALDESTRDLREREKHLFCLYGISHLVEKPNVTLDEIFQGTVDLMPASMQYPEFTSGRIVLGEKEYTSQGFKESGEHERCSIAIRGREIGHLEVYCSKRRPQNGGSFLAGERFLIRAVAERLGKAVDYRRSEREILTAKEAAESASKAKSLFLASMSHEMRTPMNSILGFTEILLDDQLTASQRESVEILKLSAETLMHLIDDILDLSKIESDTIQLDETMVDLRRLVFESMELMRAEAVGKGVKLSCHVPGGIPPAVADPIRLRQVLLNLLGNALKFTSKGEIRLDVRFLGHSGDNFFHLGFSVSDTGIGIPENKRKNIFEAFSQADPAISKQFGGTGLGLAICRRLISLMGGSIDVVSKVGEGTTFYFKLRFKKAATEIPGEAVPESGKDMSKTDPHKGRAAHAGRHLRLLLAEDDPASQRMTQLLLEKRMGHRVDIAANGVEAIEMAQRSFYDIILMDVNMPVLDGLGATRKIRENGCTTPVIALTASAMKGDSERFLGAGMDGYLPKPIKPDALANALESHFGETVHGKMEGTDEQSENIAAFKTDTDEIRAEKMALSLDEYQEVLAQFITLRKADIEDLGKALLKQDSKFSCQLAHRIKGSAKMLMLEEIAEEAARIEQYARKENLEAAETSFKRLKTVFSSLLKRA